jgi:hypothetical protein
VCPLKSAALPDAADHTDGDLRAEFERTFMSYPTYTPDANLDNELKEIFGAAVKLVRFWAVETVQARKPDMSELQAKAYVDAVLKLGF